MELTKTTLEGCYLIQPKDIADLRGCFVKPYQRAAFESHGLEGEFREDFFTVSKKDVLRGMHFQSPPQDQTKLVYCIHGVILDVIVDIRKNSPTYLQFESFELNESKRSMLYLPEGIAHGFVTLSESATIGYKVSREFVPEFDAGIRWDSIGFKWPIQNPILSEKDKNLPTLSEFKTPWGTK